MRDSLKSFLTDTAIDGTVRRRKSDGSEVDLSYNLSPTTANWVLAVILFCVTVVGAAILLVPLLEQGKVTKAIGRALADLENEAG